MATRSKGFFNSIARACEIIFIERRVPGRVYQFYYTILSSLGIRTSTKTLKNGYVVKGYTHCMSMFYEVWSKMDYDIPGFKLGPGMTVIDIGANQGFFSLYAASHGAKVYGFEPSPDNYAILSENVTRNKLEGQVSIFNQAVTGKKGTVNLFIGLDSRGEPLSGSVSTVDSNRGGNKVAERSVESTTLDSILEEFHIDHCDFLKMDCEGAEYEILANTSPMTFQKISRIAMEFHNGRWQEAVDILKNAGFEIALVQPGDVGLIKATKLSDKK